MRKAKFGTWLIRQHLRHDPVGDLAVDFSRDYIRPAPRFIKSGQDLKEHILNVCGELTPGVNSAVDRAWNEYVEWRLHGS